MIEYDQLQINFILHYKNGYSCKNCMFFKLEQTGTVYENELYLLQMTSRIGFCPISTRELAGETWRVVPSAKTRSARLA